MREKNDLSNSLARVEEEQDGTMFSSETLEEEMRELDTIYDDTINKYRKETKSYERAKSRHQLFIFCGFLIGTIALFSGVCVLIIWLVTKNNRPTTAQTLSIPMLGKEDIDELCSPTTIDKTPDNFIKCQTACSSHFCCFTNTGADNTTTTETCRFSENECEVYSSCRTVMAPVNEALVALHIETCSETNISSSEGFGACQKLCRKRACCFIPRHCKRSPGAIKWCNQLDDCENLNVVEPVEELLDITESADADSIKKL